MMRGARSSIAAGAVLVGCAAGPPAVSASSPDRADASTPPSASDETPSTQEPLRVLVTGFNDWRDLGDPPNVWRCRDNPSCRLLLGGPQLRAPATFEGPLVRALQASTSDAPRQVRWSFETLPVTWDVAQTVDYTAHDVVVHVGLGVYDRNDAVFVEAGAYNRRVGTDAAGELRDEPVDPQAAQTVAAPAAVAAAVAAVDGESFGALKAHAMAAREGNTYLCNETHFRALEAVEASARTGGRLEAAYFVHVPYAVDDDYTTLAAGVAGVIKALLPAAGASD